MPKKLTVNENLIVYGKLYGVKKIKERIKYLTEKLRLEDFLDRKTGELSSGQKNRVSLAKALINDPNILFKELALFKVVSSKKNREKAQKVCKKYNHSTKENIV